MEHAIPRRTAGIPRTWSLCMTSENHGTVGPAGCKFSHAPEKHERVLVVEVPAAAGAAVDQVNLQLVGARRRRPVAEFKGYVDGEPAVTWLDRDNMPSVGTKLFAAPVAVQADHDDDADVTDLEVRDALGDQYDPEVGEAVSVLRVMAAWKAEAQLGEKYKQMALGAAQAGQVAVPEEALRVVRRLLEGSQPKDLAGAIMVIDSALNGGAAWTYEIDPPAGFADYVQANYSGDVTFHDPAWHARRLWNAAMRNLSKSSSGSTQASTPGERQEGGAA